MVNNFLFSSLRPNYTTILAKLDLTYQIAPLHNVFTYVFACSSFLWNLLVTFKTAKKLFCKQFLEIGKIRSLALELLMFLVSNVASYWASTKSHYKEFGQLAEKYNGKLVLILFPCNQFMYQEPGSFASSESMKIHLNLAICLWLKS